MTYSVKEIFYTLQGEGLHAGRPSVFCRFAGCNLWSGREADRSSAVCRFCDTEFVGTDGELGGKYSTARKLAEKIAAVWPTRSRANQFVVLTGGEPLLQVDQALVEALHHVDFEVAVETNGTIKVPPGIDWICVSPKAGGQVLQTHGHELKLVYPQAGLHPSSVQNLAFEHFLLQPMDGPALVENTEAAIAFCLANPRWRMSIQTHKVLRIR